MEKRPIDYLILVNPFHKIPEAYFDNLELVEMRGYDNEVFRVEKAAAQQFRELEKASSAMGIPILLSSAYRSIEKQRQIKEEFTTEYGADYAKRYVAEPGCSEHHTGLAFDITDEQIYAADYNNRHDETVADTEVYKWMAEHCTDYGFIVRYPEGKEEFYHMACYPGHFRYVGVEAAKYITENDLCFEEFLALYGVNIK